MQRADLAPLPADIQLHQLYTGQMVGEFPFVLTDFIFLYVSVHIYVHEGHKRSLNPPKLKL